MNNAEEGLSGALDRCPICDKPKYKVVHHTDITNPDFAIGGPQNTILMISVPLNGEVNLKALRNSLDCEIILSVLRYCEGRKSEAVMILRRSEGWLYQKIRYLGIREDVYQISFEHANKCLQEIEDNGSTE